MTLPSSRSHTSTGKLLLTFNESVLHCLVPSFAPPFLHSSVTRHASCSGVSPCTCMLQSYHLHSHLPIPGFVAYDVLPGIPTADLPEHLQMHVDANAEGILQSVHPLITVFFWVMKLHLESERVKQVYAVGIQNKMAHKRNQLALQLHTAKSYRCRQHRAPSWEASCCFSAVMDSWTSRACVLLRSGGL